MNFKKTIIYLLLSIFLLIFIYNYVLPYFILQNYNANNMNMSMGMHMKQNINNTIYNYSGLVNIIILAIAILVGFLLLDRIVFSSKVNKCKKCGLIIENNNWKVCPRCGNKLYKKEVE